MAQRKSVMNLRGEQGTEAQGPGAYKGQWMCFMVITDAQVSALDMPKEYGDVGLYEGVTYPQGFVFYGIMHAITVDSGVIQLFNGADPSSVAAQKTMSQG
jgi:hypothetical protein